MAHFDKDLYLEGMTRYYGRHTDKKTGPLARHIGKIPELGCGYGMDEKRLDARIDAMARARRLGEKGDAQ